MPCRVVIPKEVEKTPELMANLFNLEIWCDNWWLFTGFPWGSYEWLRDRGFIERIDG